MSKTFFLSLKVLIKVGSYMKVFTVYNFSCSLVYFAVFIAALLTESVLMGERGGGGGNFRML